ncbi:MAG: hypothetical protein ABSE22_00080 [Xanthobacteraceae bacterium]|jgi:hypothetical protein
MITTDKFRAKSSEYGELIKGATDPGKIRQYQDCKDSFSSLADNQAWLANNVEKMVQVSDDEPPEVLAKPKPSGAILAAEGERVLRCLGAALIMQWNTVPAKLQRQLFDAAGSMGEVLDTAELRGQIARFLHRHKDDVSPV